MLCCVSVDWSAWNWGFFHNQIYAQHKQLKAEHMEDARWLGHSETSSFSPLFVILCDFKGTSSSLWFGSLDRMCVCLRLCVSAQTSICILIHVRHTCVSQSGSVWENVCTFSLCKHTWTWQLCGFSMLLADPSVSEWTCKERIEDRQTGRPEVSGEK